MIPALRDTVLVKELKRRSNNSREASLFFGVLEPIADDITPLLEYIRNAYPSYTNHNIGHSIRIIERVGLLLSKQSLKLLTDYELFSFVLASLFHDVGMAFHKEDEGNTSKNRESHGVVGGAYFKKYFKEHMKIVYEERLMVCIQYIIECHNCSWEEMESHSLFSTSEMVNNQIVRPAILSALLRIGDLLDLDFERTSDLILDKQAPWIINKESKAHHTRHKLVKHFNYNNNIIEVKVKCDTKDQYDIWHQWFEYLKQDVEKANTYIFRDDLACFQLPKPDLAIHISKKATFELWPLRFEIDEQGRLWDVISQSIYTERYDYIRELIQNSIDACLRRIYDDPESVVDKPCPREWELVGYYPRILIEYSDSENKICISDNGIGMGKEELTNYLFKVASCGMKSIINLRHFRFPSIAEFGIGFISVLTRAKYVIIKTKNKSDKHGYYVKLDSHCRDAIVEKYNNAKIGTKIELFLDNSTTYEEIANYISQYFNYQCVPIVFINSDIIHCEIVKNDKLLSESADIIDLIYNNVKESENSIANNEYIAISNIANKCDRNRKLIRKSVCNNELYSLMLKNKKSNKYVYKKYCILCPGGTPHKYNINGPIVMGLSSSGEIIVAKLMGKKSRLTKKQFYLITIPVDYNNMEKGIEWRSLHTFIIKNGVLCREVALNTRGNVFEIGEHMEDNILDSNDIIDIAQRGASIIEDLGGEEWNPDVYDFMEQINDREDGFPYDSDNNEITADILRITNKNVEIERGAVFHRHGVKEGDVEDYFNDTIESIPIGIGKNKEKGKMVGIMDNVMTWYQENGNVYQDGIEMPVKIIDIAPIGATVGLLNLYGDARFKLNITRNNIDMNPKILKTWKEKNGKEILKYVAKEIKSTINKYDCEYQWGSMWIENKKSILGRDDWEECED